MKNNKYNQMKGAISTRDPIIKTGPFFYFYENGKRKSIINYENNKPVGTHYEFHENGEKKLEAENIYDDKNHTAQKKIKQYWDENGTQKVINGNGDYEEISEFFFASGKIKDGFKDGLWEGYDKKFGYTFSENYENKKFISGVSIDSSNVSRTYKVVELKPVPKKGYEDFYKHVGKKFQLSNLPGGLEGKIHVKFIVDKEGQIIEPEIIKGIGFGADEEALRVVSSYKNFVPGEIRGLKVRCTFTLPISIKSPN